MSNEADFSAVLAALIADANEAQQEVREQRRDQNEPLLVVQEITIERVMATSYSTTRDRLIGSDTHSEKTARTTVRAVLEPEDNRDRILRLTGLSVLPEEPEVHDRDLDLIIRGTRQVLGERVREPLQDRWRLNLRSLWRALEGDGEPPMVPTQVVLDLLREKGFPKL